MKNLLEYECFHLNYKHARLVVDLMVGGKEFHSLAAATIEDDRRESWII